VIAAVGGDGSLWFYWQTIGTVPWNPERVAGPGTTNSASVARVGNSSVIAAVGVDGSLRFYWQTIGTAPWNPERVAGPGTTNSASVAQVGNSSVIAAVGVDGSLRFGSVANRKSRTWSAIRFRPSYKAMPNRAWMN
jgi:hypothetical protein